MVMYIWILQLLPALVVLIIGCAHARSLNKMDDTGNKDATNPIHNVSIALNDSSVIVHTIMHWNNQSSSQNNAYTQLPINEHQKIDLPSLNDTKQHITGNIQNDINDIIVPYVAVLNETGFNNGSDTDTNKELDLSKVTIPHIVKPLNVTKEPNQYDNLTENNGTSNVIIEQNELSKTYSNDSQDSHWNNIPVSPTGVVNINGKLTTAENASRNASMNASMTVVEDASLGEIKTTTVQNEVPYVVHGDRVHDLQLHHDKPGVHLKHHLQLVPMEDEPFGTLIFKDERYLVSVFIPLAIGILGATIIIVTLYTMRYVAMKQGRQYPQNGPDRWRHQTAGSSSIQDDEEQTDPNPHDKIVLLSPDDDDDQF